MHIVMMRCSPSSYNILSAFFKNTEMIYRFLQPETEFKYLGGEGMVWIMKTRLINGCIAIANSR